MAWYFMILIVAGYFAIGAILAGLMHRWEKFEDQDADLFMVLFWPVVFPVFLIAGLCMFLYLIAKGDNK